MSKNGDSNHNDRRGEKILLSLMPFWAPLIPPSGISCLKGFLEQNGFKIKTKDLNVLPELWEFQSKYLVSLAKYIPVEKQGNFNMIGLDVFMNHLMAHFYRSDQDQYHEVVKVLTQKNFFFTINESQAEELIVIVESFYDCLEKYLLELYEKEKPSVFGISVYSTNLAPSLFAFQYFKKIDPDIWTIMGGGVFADQLCLDSSDLQLFLARTPFIDNIVIGEGELIFLKLLQGELPKEQKVYSIKDISGEYFRIATGGIPDFSDLDLEMYPQLTAYASRSCPFQCSFCSETIQWGKYRRKEIGKVVEELIFLSQKYQRRLFLLSDSLINPLISDLAAEIINRELNIYWDAYLRADQPVTDPDNTLFWRKGGFYRARLGLESGSPNVLRLMNKGITPEQIKNSLASLAYAGIKTTTYWVIGHPGETEKDFQDTLNLVEEIKDCIYEADWHPFYFFPHGQVNSQKWMSENQIVPIYPQEMTDLLMMQTWELKSGPPREEIFERVCRFAALCKKYRIPNPYSLADIHEADERWRLLHKNAVPTLLEMQISNSNIGESRRVKKLFLSNKTPETGDFSF